MRLVEGVHHMTFLTEDIDRLAGFYGRVFDARKTLDITEEGVRHMFLEVGRTTVLHPFQLLAGPALPAAPGTMFERGRFTSRSWRRRSRPFASSVAGSRRRPPRTATSAT